MKLHFQDIADIVTSEKGFSGIVYSDDEGSENLTKSKERVKGIKKMKHRYDLSEVMDTFGCSVREATMEALYEDYTFGGFDDSFADRYEYQSDEIIYKLCARAY